MVGMLISTPNISAGLQERLDELNGLRLTLGHEAGRPLRWMGTLGRFVRATSAEGSISIEGFHVPEGEAVALANREEPVDPGDENRMALSCYARAMDHVGAMAGDPSFRWLDRVILDLHFDACGFQRDMSPGLWRTGPIGITAGDGSIAYEGPEAGEVRGLMGEVVDWLEEGDLDTHVVIRAAMAHLHVVSVHPFRDGNGRISRIVQSLVLAREGLVSPEFGSIEEYLAENTPAYYAALNEAHGASYEPRGSDATSWVEFCVEAHLRQARKRLGQIEEAGARWAQIEALVAEHGWPDRLAIALEQSLVGGADRAGYCAEAGISQATASADFRRLLDAGLVTQQGRGRATRYQAADALRWAVKGSNLRP
jgi:DNA-binding transcriptional ArsR family regulator